VGATDILMGILLLIYPIRAVAGWLVCWGFVTASLRPLSGEPFGEMIERAGNFGAPLALLLLSSSPSGGLKGWWSRIDPHPRPDGASHRHPRNGRGADRIGPPAALGIGRAFHMEDDHRTLLSPLGSLRMDRTRRQLWFHTGIMVRPRRTRYKNFHHHQNYCNEKSISYSFIDSRSRGPEQGI